MEEDHKNNMENRTEEVQDIIERIPHRTGRIVALFVVALAGLLLFFGWLIEYPEKVTGPVSITARQAPVKLVSNYSGKLHLLKSNLDTLKENEVFAFLDNPAKLEDVLLTEELLNKCNPDSIYTHPYLNKLTSSISLGELSSQYYSFLNAVDKVHQYRTGQPYEKKLRSLVSMLKSQVLLRENSRKQLKVKRSSLKIAEKNVHRDSILFLSSTIAELDVDRSSINYYGVLESSQAVERDNTSIGMQIEDTRYKLQTLLLEQNETESKLKMDLIASYNGLISGIRKWKITYCFTSPIEGKLEYLNFWRESDFITAGTEVFSIIPSDNPILGQIFLPSTGAGKVVEGQDVIIKLDNYPYIEYGSINGKVKTISQLSNQSVGASGQNKINTYLITVDLPKELTTNYGTKLNFRYEIRGVADILTKRRKLLERLFDNLKYIVSKK